MFSKKLDLLMHVAEISNVQLANELHLDPSYISKLRNGKRTLPKQSDFLTNLSSYLSKQIKREYQKKAIEDIMQKEWSDNVKESERDIFNWLCEEKFSGNIVAKFLKQISMPVSPASSEESLITNIENDEAYYLGIEGKRKAVIQFFNKILASNNRYQLKLFSDEESSWLLEDPKFLQTWRKVFEEVLKKGNRITIVHNISRDLDELIESVVQWIPIYMTGAISPYFCPRKRDGIFQRTIFLAPKLTAVISNSVCLESEDMLNILVNDEDALNAIEKEYDEYLKICRPLMDIVSKDYSNQYKRLYKKIKEYGGKTFYKGKFPSLATMSKEQVNKLEKENNAEIMALYKEARRELEDILEENEIHEILQVPISIKEDEKAVIPQSVFWGKNMLKIGNEDLKSHYREILRLLKEHDNYYVYLCEEVDENLNVLVRRDGGVVVERLNYPPTLFGIEEQNMSSAFLNHMEEICRLSKMKDKKRVISYLEEYTK